MKIVLKSKPLNAIDNKSEKSKIQRDNKIRDTKRKGTRGPSWIG